MSDFIPEEKKLISKILLRKENDFGIKTLGENDFFFFSRPSSEISHN